MSNATKTIIPVVALFSFVIFNSCDLLKKCAECICEKATIDNPSVNAFFAAADDLEVASIRVRGKLNAALLGLAQTLEIAGPEDTTPPGVGEISKALCDAFSNAGISFDIQYQEPECHASAEITAAATAECEGKVDPGEVTVVCHGRCDGTCKAECTGECTVPSFYAACQGECYGSCRADVSGVCYGTCYGQCDGTCSATDESGHCAGSCEGNCTGKCELKVEGQCSGECYGECTVEADPGGCNGRCKGECRGGCEGECYGEVEPPEVEVHCEAQIEARAKASIECDPPQVTFGVDTSSIPDIGRISYYLGEVIAANAEVKAISSALENYISVLSDSAEAVIEGELSSDELLCAINKLPDAISALNEAKDAISTLVNVDAELLSCQ